MELINLDKVTKKYKNIKALDNLSFFVAQGDIIGLIGANGAGKSTTIALLATLIKPDEGKIWCDGEDIVKNPKSIQKKLGYVPQEIALYPTLTAAENLRFWGGAYGLKGEELESQIDKIADLMGLTERMKDKISRYSQGMKRKLNIGAALLHHPKIIIMDEPTVGIDMKSREQILAAILQLNKEGATIIYTSHYMDEIDKICNKICLMDEGKVVAFGEKDSIAYKQILNLS